MLYDSRQRMSHTRRMGFRRGPGDRAANLRFLAAIVFVGRALRLPRDDGRHRIRGNEESARHHAAGEAPRPTIRRFRGCKGVGNGVRYRPRGNDRRHPVAPHQADRKQPDRDLVHRSPRQAQNRRQGARRPRSPFAGRLDLFFAAEITYSPRPHERIARPARGGRAGLARGLADDVSAHARWPRISSNWSRCVPSSNHAVPELYDLLRRALDFLDKNEPTRRAMFHFESQLSQLLGVTGTHNADADPGAGHRAPVGRVAEGSRAHLEGPAAHCTRHDVGAGYSGASAACRMRRR